MVEATAVEARGRISPEDLGIWKDEHVAPLKRVADVIHASGQKAAIQLAHAGRKASDVPAWIGRATATGRSTAEKEVSGWPDKTVGPSPLPYDEGLPVPNELSVGEIQDVIKAWGDGARRAVEAGFGE
ncbi:hypothetical protein IMZ48_00430 [Candidatus Bathyarchaeota archaeon]|nr:hypothetical protein [Candidatus Bathyarchaeota archaeon]